MSLTLLPPLTHFDDLLGRVFRKSSISARLLCSYVEAVANEEGLLSQLSRRHLAELVIDAFRSFGDEARAVLGGTESLHAARMASMLQLIAIYARDPNFALKRAAEFAGVSLRTAERDFSRAGTRFTDELMNVRLSYAREKLADGRDRVSEIAYDAGFSDLSHFNRSFKASFGCSPSQWRGRRALEAVT